MWRYYDYLLMRTFQKMMSIKHEEMHDSLNIYFSLAIGVREVMFSSTSQVSQGLSATEYTAIGLSSVILALIYIASVSLYLHSRRAKRKSIEEANVTLDGGRDGGGLVKSNPLLAAARHFESDTNSGLTESDLGEDLPASDNEQGFENVSTMRIVTSQSFDFYPANCPSNASE